MALVLADRIQETASAPGTATLTLAGASLGYKTFASGVGSGNTTYYTIVDATANVWEVGVGTVGTGTLSRDTVLSNSSGTTAKINFANSVTVWCDYPAGKAVYLDESNVLTLSVPEVISVNSSSDALRITQTGAGNALVVEDSANPDSTPFVVDANGVVGMGTPTPQATFSLSAGIGVLSSTAYSPQIAQRNKANDISAPYFIVQKDRAGAIVQAGDYVGTLAFQAYDGASYLSAASIHAQIDGTPGTNDMPGRLVFSVTADGASTPTEALRINNNKSVKFSGAGYTSNVALTDAATIAWDANAAQVATFTFVSTNRTVGAPTNLVNGAFYALAVIQNAGSNTLTWNSVFKWASGAAPTLSTAAGARDYFVFRSDGTNLYEQGRSQAVA